MTSVRSFCSNMEKIRNGISETIGHFVMMFFDITISILISFIYGWRLTLAICAYIPLTMIINYLVSKVGWWCRGGNPKA